MKPRPVVGKAAVPEAVRRLMDKFDYPDRESPTQVIPILPTLGGDGGDGAFVHLSRSATQSIAAAGEAISWDVVDSQIEASGWEEFTAGTTITIPRVGYYNVAIQIGWSTFDEGGNVKVQRTRAADTVTVWPPADDPGLWTATDGVLFEGTAHAVPFSAGDTLEVILDPDDASSQTLASATVAVYLVDTSGLAVSGYRAMVLADGPIAYWRLGEASVSDSAYDETGNGHDGTYTAGVVLGGAGVLYGDSDTSAAFDEATNDGVDVTIATALKLLDSDYTVEVWVNITANLAVTRYIIGWVAAVEPAWGIGVEQSGANLRFHGSRNDVNEATTGYDYSLNTWYYVVVTYDAGTDAMTLYVNTVSAATGTSVGAITDTANNVRIGRHTSVGIDGEVDEAAVYDRILTTVEIADHYRVGTQGA